MKFCLINNLYGPYAKGGAEKVIEKIKNELLLEGHEVIIVSTRPWFKKPQESQESPGHYYLRSLYHHLGRLPKVFRLFYHVLSFLNIFVYLKLFFLIKKHKVSVLWTNSLTGLGPWVFKLAGHVKDHLHTVHDIQLLHPSGLLLFKQEKLLNSLASKIFRFLNKQFISIKTRVIFPSEWIRDLHLDKGLFKNSLNLTLANPIKINKDYALDSNKIVNDSKEITFLYVGQIERHKGIEILLQAFCELEHDAISLKIAGQGGMKDYLSSRYNDQRIKWLGQLESKKVNELMKEANCLIVPSLCYENQPTVILEARAFNLPVLASCLGGTNELLKQSFLFKPTKEDLKRALNDFLNNPNKENISCYLDQELFETKEYLEKVLDLLVID